MTMNDIRRLLQEGDPLTREPLMSADAADRMRRVVLGETRQRPVAPPMFVMAMSGALSLVVGAGIWAVQGPTTERPAPVAVKWIDGGETEMSASTSASRRQVQFSTPGGTRVIWQLDTTSH